MTRVTVAATQMACDWNKEGNIERGETLIREAAGQGAQLILLQELFEGPYFPITQREDFFTLAQPAGNHPTLLRFSALAKELGVVLPISFFERDNNAYFNSLAIIDADGSILGIYRKSHIPDGPAYQEKFYFNPGNTGFKVWDTRYCRIGAAVCWDQWFPETARILALQGAELIFYPTAIGSEPQDSSIDSKPHWQLVQRGHAAANQVPVIASNRIGVETHEDINMTFYGSSFITDHQGELLAEASRDQQQVITASLDLDIIRGHRASWGLFRDRRTDLYQQLLSLDGSGH